MKETKIVKYIGCVFAGTTFSRIAGYIRDMLVGWLFGASSSADAFYAALKIPNLFRQLLGEGSLSTSFVPVFSEYLTTNGKKETEKLFNVVITTLMFVLLVVCVLGMIFAPQITRIIACGFEKNPEKLSLTITLTRLMFPFLFFICLAAFLLAVLNSLKFFFIPAIAPFFLSLSEIVFIMGIAPLLVKENQIKGLAIAVIIGGLLQFLIQVPLIKKSGFNFKPIINFKHPGLKQIFFLMIPAMLGISINQINAFVDTICASFLIEGSITALYYSNRLMQLPLALFGIAVTSVSLPLMSASISKNNSQEMKDMLAFSIKISSLAILPAMAGLLILGKPIIILLFQHGKFNETATLLTSSALIFYSLGLPAFSYAKIFASGFYSMKETKTPVKIATVCIILNVVLNIILMKPLGVGGLALATAISSWVNTALLFILLRNKIGRFGGKKIFLVIYKIILATLAMSIVCYIFSKHFVIVKNLFFNTFGTIIIAVIVYFFVARLLKISEMKSVLSIIKREKFSLDE
ncbi:MAG: murein biosynthesis integral membrane protein MurJ [Elusimicrobiota bacterium]